MATAMGSSTPLFIVIPVHNRRAYTKECLESLRKQTAKDFAVIVVDDGSTDGTGEMIRTEFPEVILLQSEGNLWWTRATNMGVKYALDAGASFIMALNNDTILADDFIERMFFWAEKEPKSLLGAFAIDAETSRPAYGGETIDWTTTKTTFLLDVLPLDEQHGLHRVTHFPGRGLLIPREVIEQIGMFDSKRFPHYAADYDFTHRAIRAGYRVFCNYDARVYIYPDASTSIDLRRNRNLRNYYLHLFSNKGGGNLKVFLLYAWRNCPRGSLPSFVIIGLLRKSLGYLYHWVRELLSTKPHFI